MAADDGQPSRTQTFQVKGRACVDPVSGMQHESHVLQVCIYIYISYVMVLLSHAGIKRNSLELHAEFN